MSPTRAGDVCVLTEAPPTLFFLDESTHEIMSSMKLDGSPLTVGIHHDRQKVYTGVFNRGLVVHSRDAGQILATVKTKPGIGPCPETFGFTPDGSQLLVIDTQPVDLCWGTVTAVRVDDDSVVSTSRIELHRMSEEGIESSGSGSVSLAFSADGKKVFVALPTMSHISILDATSHQPLRTIRLGDRMGTLITGSRGTKLCVSNMGDQGPRLSIVDTSTEAVTGEVKLPQLPSAMSLSVHGVILYAVTNLPEPVLHVVDLSEGDSIATIPLEDACSALAVSPDGQRVFVAHIDAPRISLINTDEHSASGAVELRAPASSLLVVQDGQRLCAAHSDRGSVSVLDISEHPAEIDHLEIGQRPHFVPAFFPGLRASEESEVVSEHSSTTGRE